MNTKRNYLTILLLTVCSLGHCQPTITALEYFFDTDPGPGNGTAISFTAGTSLDLSNINISTTSLSIGWHTVHVRARDANNVWGFYESRQIYVREATVVTSLTIEPITAIEFFFDTDNGSGTGTAIPVATGTTVDVMNTNLTTTLPVGWHTVHVRAKNSNNVWGFYESRPFFVRGPAQPCCGPPSPIAELEWFVDADPGVGLATSKKLISPSQASIDLVDEPLDVGVQPLGSHNIYMRAKNDAGEWSMAQAASFSVTSACPIISAPSASGVSRCDPGSVTLTGSGAGAGETYRWYANSSANTPIFTGNPYNTPTIASNTTYYVSTYNPTTFCESGRTPVTADFSGIPKPSLSITGSLSVCEGTTQVITAPPGFTSYIWSNGLTTQQITVANSGSYSVVVNNGVCSSPPSDAFTLTVNAKPSKPVITATNGGTLCGVGFVTLNAPAGFTSYNWSTGQNTPGIDVTAVGSYTLSVTNTDGCQSIVSDPFAITNGAIATPTISTTDNTTLCGGGTATLSAPNGFSGYLWSNGATSRSITVSTAGSYSVIVDNGTCTSSSSGAITVTETLIPTQPTIQVTGSTTLCNGSFVALSAPNGFTNYAWSNGETSRQIVVTAAGMLSVQVGNASHCLSAASPSVTVTSSGQPCSGSVLTPPASPVASSGSRCDAGTVVLSASGATSGQEYRWYENVASATVLATTSSFTTPTITQTTDYYVAVYDPVSNLESNRVKAIATIVTFVKPVVSPSSSISICNGSSVLLAGPIGFLQYRWTKDDRPLTIHTQQLSVTEAGRYSVSIGDGTCYSPLSEPVIISIDIPLAKPIITGTSTICGSETSTLSSTAGDEYLWSNNANTQQTQVTAGTYRVTVRKGSCSSTSDPFVVNAVSMPSAPSITVVGKEVICVGSLVALSAPSGFSHYRWSNGESTQTILVDKPESFTVQTGFAANCLSPKSAELNVRMGSVAECGIVPSPTNHPPEIQSASFAVQIQGEASYPLLPLVNDDDDNLDPKTLRIVEGPLNNNMSSGGKAVLDSENNLLLDYRGLNFAGKEYITLQACDTDGICSQQQITIDVVGEVRIYNGMTPDGDGINDFMLIQFIDVIEGARKNRVSIMNRWGDVIFEMDDYNNTDRVFAGLNNKGQELPGGTYLYKIALATGQQYTGFITLKR